MSESDNLFFRRNLAANLNRDIILFKRDQPVISLKYLIRLRLVLRAAGIKTENNKPCGLRSTKEEEEQEEEGGCPFQLM